MTPMWKSAFNPARTLISSSNRATSSCWNGAIEFELSITKSKSIALLDNGSLVSTRVVSSTSPRGVTGTSQPASANAPADTKPHTATLNTFDRMLSSLKTIPVES
jgi:hypothetical protein